MQYLRCKCGKATCSTSMGVQDCQGCAECKTTFAGHPDHHEELKEHEWVTRYNTHTGKPFKQCSKCYFVDVESYNNAKS